MTEKIYSFVKVWGRKAVLALTFVSLAGAVSAQSTTIRGVVKDTHGNPLIGVTVIAVGTQVGASTLGDGSYTLSVPAGVTQLKFTYLGYEEVTVAVNRSQTTVNVTMKESATAIEGVVIEVNVGYGTVAKRDLTGSVASVSDKVLAAMPVSNVTEAIAGRMAGVSVTATEGGPDADIKVRVRGGGSVTQDNSPLYIVDGFTVSSINDIPPSDIQSIDVLKDASSTAIYGARGANGVIIVTTKSGQAGKPQISFNAYVGTKNITKTLDVMDPYEYVMWQYELANYNATTVDGDKNFSKFYGAFDDLELYRHVKGTDWQREIFGRTALTQNYNASVRGGTETMKYNLSLSHVDDQSIMITSGFVRDNINFKMSTDFSKYITMDFNGRWANTVIDGVGTSTDGTSSVPRLRHTLKYTPVAGMSEFIDDDDYLSEMENSSQLINPYLATVDEWRQTTRRNQAYSAAINIKPIKSIVWRTEAGVTYSQDMTDRFYGPATSRSRSLGGGNPIVTKEDRDGFQWRVSNTLTYTPKLSDDHRLTLLLGQEANSSTNKNTFFEVRNLSHSFSREQALANTQLGTPEPVKATVGTPNNLLSFFGRANYSLMDKYLLTLSMRADGSSKFAPGHRWGYFPSAALAWRLNEESFMASTKGWLDNLKLRASYGAAGNNRIGDDLWRYLYSTSTSSKPIAIGDVTQTVMTPSGDLPNLNLKWETTITRDLGLDFSIYKGRLNGTVDVYWNTTKDLLMRASIPSSSGFSYQYQNIGRTSNKGVELTLDGLIVDKKEFRLGMGFNIAFNRNRIDALGEAQSFYQSTLWYNSSNPAPDYYVAVGQPVGLIYGYVTKGMYTVDDFNYTYDPNTGKGSWTLKDGVASSSNTTGSPDLPGTLKLWDKDDNGQITSEDRQVIGNTNPDFTGGFNIYAQWGQFDFAAYFNFVYGNDIYNANKLELTSYPDSRRYGNLLDIMESRYTYIDRSTGLSLLNDYDALVAANQNATIWSPIISKVPVHSWAVEDGSFLRLNNVTIGYTLPQRWSKKLAMSSLRVYVTGYNLALFTKYTGFDPEVDARRSTPLTPGVDYSAFPKARTIVLGVNITF